MRRSQIASGQLLLLVHPSLPARGLIDRTIEQTIALSKTVRLKLD